MEAFPFDKANLFIFYEKKLPVGKSNPYAQ